MEIESNTRLEIKSRQLSQELKSQRAKSVVIAGQLVQEHGACEAAKKSFDLVRRELSNPKLAKPRAQLVASEHLAKLLRANKKSLELHEAKAQSLQQAQDELSIMMQKINRTLSRCNEMSDNAVADYKAMREDCDQDDLVEIISHQRSTENVEERGYSAASSNDNQDRSATNVSQDARATVDRDQSQQSSQQSAAQQHHARDQGQQQSRQSFGGSSGNSRSYFVTSSTQRDSSNEQVLSPGQFARCIEGIHSWSGAVGNTVVMNYLSAQGRRLEITISGGGAYPVRLHIAPESPTDRRILWNDSQAIRASFDRAGVKVAEITVGGSAARKEEL